LAIILLISANKALQNKQPVVEAINDQITDSVTVAEPETKHQPVYKQRTEIPQILSYRNKFKNEREKKYKK
jgi:hypothetical protein